MSLVLIVKELLEKYTLKELSTFLNVSPGTITRWIELKDVPIHYEFDLLKLMGTPIDYSKYSSKQKDQFFTPERTAKHCFDVFCETLKQLNENVSDFTFIEPSAGNGNFLHVTHFSISMDIEPMHESILKQDFLEWKPPEPGRYVVFGNPPFGLRGNLALRFINHSKFAEYICFILPQLFESDGKGSPRKRIHGFHLIHSEKIDNIFYEPNKKEIKINCIFQIWSKNHTSEKYTLKENTHSNVKIYSLSNGGTVATTRNKKMIGNCDIYLPSTCFGKENMRCYDSFEELPGKKGYGIVFEELKDEFIDKMKSTDWTTIAFLSTNSAYNLRSSQINMIFN